MIDDNCPYQQQDANHCHCGTPLKGRQTRYCGRKCSRQVRDNHRWTQAKAAALASVAHYQCEHCQLFYQKKDINVDHIEPCLGKHGVWGCHHHQDNLRVLCIECHKARTAAQRAAGEI